MHKQGKIGFESKWNNWELADEYNEGDLSQYYGSVDDY